MLFFYYFLYSYMDCESAINIYNNLLALDGVTLRTPHINVGVSGS